MRGKLLKRLYVCYFPHLISIKHPVYSPIVHFHVLPVEKENSGGDVTDVEVSCVNWRFVYINDIDGRHVTEVMGGF